MSIEPKVVTEMWFDNYKQLRAFEHLVSGLGFEKTERIPSNEPSVRIQNGTDEHIKAIRLVYHFFVAGFNSHETIEDRESAIMWRALAIMSGYVDESKLPEKFKGDPRQQAYSLAEAEVKKEENSGKAPVSDAADLGKQVERTKGEVAENKGTVTAYEKLKNKVRNWTAGRGNAQKAVNADLAVRDLSGEDWVDIIYGLVCQDLGIEIEKEKRK